MRGHIRKDVAYQYVKLSHLLKFVARDLHLIILLIVIGVTIGGDRFLENIQAEQAGYVYVPNAGILDYLDPY